MKPILVSSSPDYCMYHRLAIYMYCGVNNRASLVIRRMSSRRYVECLTHVSEVSGRGAY